MRQDDSIDHVNDAVRRVDIGLHTFALSTITVPPLALMSIVSPVIAFAARILTTSVDETGRRATWRTNSRAECRA